jgi:hypothetical protein
VYRVHTPRSHLDLCATGVPRDLPKQSLAYGLAPCLSEATSTIHINSTNVLIFAARHRNLSHNPPRGPDSMHTDLLCGNTQLQGDCVVSLDLSEGSGLRTRCRRDGV